MREIIFYELSFCILHIWLSLMLLSINFRSWRRQEQIFMSRVMLFIWANYFLFKSALHWHLFLTNFWLSYFLEILGNSSNIHLVLEIIPHYLIMTVTNKPKKKNPIILIFFYWGNVHSFLFDIASKGMYVNVNFVFFLF